MARIGPGHLAFAAVGLVVGLSLGGLGPREELRVSRAETRAAARSGAGSEIARIFQGRPFPREADEAADAVESAPEAALPPDPSDPPDPPGEDGPDLPDGSSREAMREALALRQQLARAALLEDAQPSEEQLQEIDATFAEMNADLHALASDFVSRFEQGAEPTRRDMMLFAADSLDVLIDTEDRLGAALTEEQVADLSEESLDPLSYVDPSLVDLLGEIDR